MTRTASSYSPTRTTIAITRVATHAWLTHYSPKVVKCRTERDIHAVVTNTRVFAACALQSDSNIQN
jgi:hypothetical protein